MAKGESSPSTFIIAEIINAISYLGSFTRIALRILFVDFFAFTAETVQKIPQEFNSFSGIPKMYFITNQQFI